MTAGVEILHEQLARFPADRYPVQHATARFHLGTALLQAGRTADAMAALAVAERLFDAAGMRLERAKAQTMHGAALRESGQPAAAAEIFAAAAQTFLDLGQTAEQAAARYNLGLVLMESGDPDRAAEAFALAQDLFSTAGHTAQAGAAARECGTLLLNAGDPAAAIPLLEQAVELARRTDAAGAAAAGNVLGLARLAGGDPTGAVGAFRDALAGHPRSVRPAEHAMVKANLALGYEAAGEPARARLAAAQATGTRGAPAPVVAQARELLDRLPPETGAELLAVLDDEPVERWSAWIRDEVLRWVDATPVDRNRAAAAWVAGLGAHGGDRTALAEAMLDVLLELPPSGFEPIVSALVQAAGRCSDDDAARFRAPTRSAMARFPVPQWQRLTASFSAAATRLGQRQDWT